MTLDIIGNLKRETNPSIANYQGKKIVSAMLAGGAVGRIVSGIHGEAFSMIT
ncbi:MAG: hypothetical protein WCB46_10860 [Methanoregula sp.]